MSDWGYELDEHPEQVGYQFVAELDWGESYEWDILKVWKRVADGALFYYRAGGCSCNGFTDDLTEAALTELTDATWLSFEKEAEAISDVDVARRHDFYRVVREAMRKS